MKRPLAIYCLLAGACDAVTGALLVASPTTVLGLMGAQEIPGDLIFLRFVGAFVAAIGLSYWMPLVLSSWPGQRARLRVTLDLTTMVRLIIGTFVLVAISIDALDGIFWSVAATDLSLAAAQVILLIRGGRYLD